MTKKGGTAEINPRPLTGRGFLLGGYQDVFNILNTAPQGAEYRDQPKIEKEGGVVVKSPMLGLEASKSMFYPQLTWEHSLLPQAQSSANADKRGLHARYNDSQYQFCKASLRV